ncbi:SDR family NAD(P)-dependent oxidoreductase [Microbacterium maritypicum]|uniref:SDR family NAD(P)-dependent oxidoreductase n=1 Tax=Microbacterium maritypicum TaxID=33918 RepID=UPI0037F5CB34
MDLQLDGCVVVVTAAGGGIGRAICEQLVNEHATVFACSSHPPTGHGIIPVAVDLMAPDAASRIARLVDDRFGRLDALITVLGGPEPTTAGFAQRQDDRWERAFNFNLLSGIRLIRETLPLLARADEASIVHVGSDLGRQPDPLFIEYAAMKSALLSMSKSLSIELGPRIRSNVLSPGPTRTPGLLADFERELAPAWGVSLDQAIDRYVSEIRQMPSGRLAEPAEVGRAAAFLASRASAPMTGTELVIDGGTRKAA